MLGGFCGPQDAKFHCVKRYPLTRVWRGSPPDPARASTAGLPATQRLLSDREDLPGGFLNFWANFNLPVA